MVSYIWTPVLGRLLNTVQGNGIEPDGVYVFVVRSGQREIGNWSDVARNGISCCLCSLWRSLGVLFFDDIKANKMYVFNICESEIYFQ
jgi:hypothetical protein